MTGRQEEWVASILPIDQNRGCAASAWPLVFRSCACAAVLTVLYSVRVATRLWFLVLNPSLNQQVPFLQTELIQLGVYPFFRFTPFPCDNPGTWQFQIVRRRQDRMNAIKICGRRVL